jgi:tripartite ATP-independent transporter DctP family solute receptor
MSMKHLQSLLLALLVLAIAVSCQAQSYTLTLGHGAQLAHPTHLASLEFAKRVEEKSNGRLKVNVFGNRQLGEERDLVEGLQLGTVDIAVVSTGPIGGFVPEITVVDLPFLFSDESHAYRVLDGPIGEELMSKLEPLGILGLSIWENGWRHLTTNKPVKTPADLRGMKVRTMENKIHMAAFRAMGAGPTPMVWGEVYTSLQQGVIDAQENPIPIIYTNALWEVQEYIVLTGHFYGPHLFLFSKMTMDKLPADLQRIVRETAREVAPYQRNLIAEQSAEQIVQLQENGMTVIEVDKDLFREATKPVYDEFAPLFGKDLIDRILNE